MPFRAPVACLDNVSVIEAESAPREARKHQRMVRRQGGRYQRVALTAAALAVIPAVIAVIGAGLDALLSGGRYGIPALLAPDHRDLPGRPPERGRCRVVPGLDRADRADQPAGQGRLCAAGRRLPGG